LEWNLSLRRSNSPSAESPPPQEDQSDQAVANAELDRRFKEGLLPGFGGRLIKPDDLKDLERLNATATAKELLRSTSKTLFTTPPSLRNARRWVGLWWADKLPP
jgi:hypothetical protein